MIICKSIYKAVESGNKEIQILNDVNLTVQTNELLAIKGASGSGKTTLLGLIGSLDKPTQGYVEIDGVNLSNMNMDDLTQFRCDHIGIIFQNYNLIENLTVKENIEFPTFFSEGKSNDVDSLINEVGLSEKAETVVSQLSGGEKQRVSIARALVNNPKYILADEPTGSLDENNTENVLSLLMTLKRKFEMTIIIVTHDDHIASFADRIVTLTNGGIIE